MSFRNSLLRASETVPVLLEDRQSFFLKLNRDERSATLEKVEQPPKMKRTRKFTIAIEVIQSSIRE